MHKISETRYFVRSLEEAYELVVVGDVEMYQDDSLQKIIDIG